MNEVLLTSSDILTLLISATGMRLALFLLWRGDHGFGVKGGWGVALKKSSSALSACSNSAAQMMDCFFASLQSAFAWALAVYSTLTSSLVQQHFGVIGSSEQANLLLALVLGRVIWLRM